MYLGSIGIPRVCGGTLGILNMMRYVAVDEERGRTGQT